MQSVRIAISGAGWVTEHHLAAYRALGDAVRVEAIADPDPAALAERAERWAIPRRFASDAEMLAAVEVDALDVANPRQHHAASVRLAAAHGLAIFCQKPLAPTWDDARALVDDLPAGTRLMVHENWRHRPHYGIIRDWVTGGRIGNVRQALMLARSCGLLPAASGRLPALERQPMLAGLDRMLLMEVMIHHLDALRSVLGEMDLRGAVLGSDTDAIRGEDRATLLLEAGGAAVSIVGDFRTHGAPAGLSDELSIQGTEGAITLEGERLRLLAGDRVLEEVRVDLAADYAASYRLAVSQFLQAVRRGDTDDFSTQVEDNLRTLHLIERAYDLAQPLHPAAPGG